MLTAVIADDEKGIVELIKCLIDEKKVQIKILGEAYNGQDALQMICDYQPDVAITDIRMPGLSGLDLIKMCKEKSPETSYVIISGFQEFLYAQEALKYGVVDYLLKPIKRLALNEALMKIDREKMNLLFKKAEVQERSFILETNTRLLRRQAIEDIIHRKKIEDSTVTLLNKNNVFVQKPGNYCFAIIKLIDTLHISNDVSKDTVDVLMEKIVRCLQNTSLDLEFVSYDSYGALYIHRKSTDYSLEKEKTVLDKEIYNNNYTYELLEMLIAIGKVVDKKEELAESYCTALEVLHEKIDSDKGNVVCYDDCALQITKKNKYLKYSDMQDIKKAVAKMDKTICLKIVHDLFSAQRMSAQPGRDLYPMATEILETFYHELKTAFPDCSIETPERSLKMIDLAVYSVILEDICSKYIEQAFDECSLQRENVVSKPVREMCRYMQEHVKEQVSLKDLASHVALNQVYVSNIFKKEMGISISSYYINLKMEYAKELLRNSTMTVSMIAEEVGYQDAKFFSKQFIKTVGIKPMDYRKFYV